MSRRPRAAVSAPVTWRDGVHLTGTPIWCDARRRRDICFVSSASPDRAQRMTKAAHGQLVATPLTLALLGAGDHGQLGVPLHKRFTLGTLRLELLASGRGPGAASLFVDIAGRCVLFAGPIRTDVPAVTGLLAVEPAEVRACDAVVVAVPYATDGERRGSIAETIDRVEAWCRAELAVGRRPALLVDTVLDGIEVAAVLGARGLALATARPIRDALRRLEDNAALGPARDALPSTSVPGKEPRATIWLESDRAGLARALDKHPYETAVLSEPSELEKSFAWPCSATKPALLEWIESTGARHVFLTGPGAPKLQATLGNRARVLGPPHQMSLFPREAMS